jgi:hypothetical protein
LKTKIQEYRDLIDAPPAQRTLGGKPVAVRQMTKEQQKIRRADKTIDILDAKIAVLDAGASLPESVVDKLELAYLRLELFEAKLVAEDEATDDKVRSTNEKIAKLT